ncbi:ABC transporter substrate-binding protein [Polyangium sorediatum]|uniref:ABC transporter substrate-binding protein n=1 Tax=Polyangium sorediatum TaxID=889274 RepID=A0ABT6NPL4_9BACT|nr:ABC transporter substrate-binding protein [Polyangium sorediatum]MDI1430269.1 ABC transporter substrate-binding protein [Polyangium sorediatum]
MGEKYGRREWITALACGALSSALAAPGCDRSGAGSGGASANEWRVGVYLSLSGADTSFGVDTREGIALAVDEINAAGGVKGRPIKLLFEDDKSNPQEASNKVLQLINRDKVVALLGEVSSARSKAAGIVANKNQIPMIAPSATNAEVTKVGPFVFRACYTDDKQGQVGARFVVETLGKKRLAVLFASDDLYSSGLADEFRREAKKLGAEVVLEKSFLKNETNFTTYLNEIRDARPEIIYAPVYYNAMVPIARQAKAAGIPGSQFVGGDGWHADSLVTDAGEEIEGAYFTNHFSPDVPWPHSQAFVKAYAARFKREPSALAAQGYDAAKLLADAIGRAKGDTPASIRDAIAETKDFQGATGKIAINAERNADKPLVIVQLKGKKFTYHSTVGDK